MQNRTVFDGKGANPMQNRTVFDGVGVGKVLATQELYKK